MKRTLRRVLIVLLLGVFLFSAAQMVQRTEDYRSGAKAYRALSAYARAPEQSEEHSEKDDGLPWPEVDFAALEAVNPETVGWLFSEGTVINYPVAQGKDNDYYLHHLLDGSENRCGCLFLDAQNRKDFSDFHSIIYGHHMKDGSMFKGLKGYQEQEYFEKHPVLLLVTPEHQYRVELFAGYVSKTTGNAWQLAFADDEEKEAWLWEQRKLSCFQSEVVPTAEDHILTLSTCSYEFKNARFVVHGVLKEKGTD